MSQSHPFDTHLHEIMATTPPLPQKNFSGDADDAADLKLNMNFHTRDLSASRPEPES